MALSQKLEIRQSQALVMTPQLMQAIKLLQLSNLDLVAYVDNELERNPLLERTAESEAELERRSTDSAPAEPPADDWPERPVDAVDNAPEAHRDAAEQAGDDDNAGGQQAPSEAPLGYSEWGTAPAARRDDGDFNLEAFASAERTLSDHLAEQLALAVTEPARRMIGQYLIDCVDEAGYLTGDLAAVAEKLGTRLPRSKRSSTSCRRSIRPVSVRAASPNVWPFSSRNAIVSIPRCGR